MTDTRDLFERTFALCDRQKWQHKDASYKDASIQAKWEGWQKAQTALSEQQIRDAAEQSRTVFNDACNHTKDAIEYMEQVLLVQLATPAPTAPSEAAFSVKVSEMVESHRKTYWVVLDSAARPKDASIFDDTGRITPFYSENREHAVHTAKEWAEFLGVTAPEPCGCLMCEIPKRAITQVLR